MPTTRWHSIVFDCARPSALARFWAVALGYAVRPYDQEEIDRLAVLGYTIEDDPAVVIDPPAEGPEIPTVWFTRIPEGKVVKNRVHLDITLESLADVHHLVGLGATVLRQLGDEGNDRWLVMADPEGNEFCAFPPANERMP
jgi:hypothetical protein